MCSSLGEGAQSTTFQITTLAGNENPHRFLLLVRVFGATPLSQHCCTLQNKELRLFNSWLFFCPSCLQHEQPFPRHVWEWQAPTSTPGCPGLPAAGTALPFGHNSSSHGFVFPRIRELGCCGLSCCSSAFTQVLASPTSTRGDYKLGWARQSSEFKGNGSWG